MKRSILYIAFLSYALAQQGSYGDENYQDHSGRDNFYDNYAERQNNKKALGAWGGGWPKILVAGIGGYIVGAKVQSHRFKKSTAPKLRFKLKQRVECKIGPSEWAAGTITELWHAPSPGQWMPYQIRLDDRQMIFALQDNNMIIRVAK